MRTQSLTAYAAAHGLSLQKLLAFYRRGLVPEYVGRVAKPPISVAAWSAKNGISRRTGLALYREKKCPPGVLLGQRSAAACTPWWMSKRYDNPVAAELRRLAKQRQQLEERASVDSTFRQGTVEIVQRDQANRAPAQKIKRPPGSGGKRGLAAGRQGGASVGPCSAVGDLALDPGPRRTQGTARGRGWPCQSKTQASVRRSRVSQPPKSD